MALAIGIAGLLDLRVLDVPLSYIEQLSTVHIDARVGDATALRMSCKNKF